MRATPATSWRPAPRPLRSTAPVRDPAHRDRAFYEGKVAVARFFATTRLPLLTAERAIIDAADDSLMELDEAAF